MRTSLLPLAALLPGLALAANPTVEWGEPDTSELRQQASALAARESAPKELTQVLSDIQLSIEKDTIRRRVRQIWYYPGAADVQEKGIDQIRFNEKKDALIIHTAATLDSSGQVNLFSPANLRITDRQENNIFTDSRMAVLALPGIDPGSLTLLDYEVVTKRTMMETDWSSVIYPIWTSPVQQFELSANWADAPVPVHWNNSASDVDCKPLPSGFRCTAKDLAPVRYEDGVNWRDELGQIAMGESSGWGDVISRSMTAFSQAMNDTSGSETLLQKLESQQLAPEEQIASIHEFVAKGIRYVSLSEHGNTITPHSVASVLAARYGDCKDKSAVLVHLLQQIGIDAFPVLVATERNLPDVLSVPSMGYFDHMVVCFDWQGNRHCLDATDAHTDWRHTPAWIQGKVALALQPGQTPSIIEASPYRWRLATDTKITFTSDGGIHEQQTRTYQGEYAGTMRGFLASRSGAERTEWAVTAFQQQVSNRVTPEFQFSGIEELTPELTIESDAKYDPFLDPETDLSYADNDAWIPSEIKSLLLRKRHYDDHFPGLQVQTRYEYDIGESWRLNLLTPELDLDHEFGQLTRRVTKLDNHRFLVETTLKVPEQTVAKKDVESFNRLLKLMSRESSIQFRGDKL